MHLRNLLYGFVILIFFSGCDAARTIMDSAGNGNLTAADAARGLKEALRVGTDTATSHLSLVDGFFKDNAVKILMPPEAQQVTNTLRNIGLGSLVDQAVLSMNRAAEDATKYVGNIFIDAIRQMTIQDVFQILKGGEHAATDYLRSKTTVQLTQAFSPVISKSLDHTNATRYWKDVFSAYNKISNKPVNTDLTSYVTAKALDGLFYHIGLEEAQIRQNPAARVTDILKKVFASSNTKSAG